MEETNVSGTMTVKEATDFFINIMRSLNDKDKELFLSFICNEWKPEDARIHSPLWNSTVDDKYHEMHTKRMQEEPPIDMQRIIADIRQRVPFDAILPSEHIVPPTKGENSGCDPKVTIHVDGFLYDDNDVNELIDEGKLQSSYCGDCGSKNVKSCVIISHSMSVDTMLYIFNNVLPLLHGKTLLDIGSRLGAVLYGAYAFSPAEKIVGVEMNAELCELQREIIQKYRMGDRVEIVNKKIEDCPEIVQTSDVIIINNSFEFYVPESVHAQIWKFLRTNTKKGTILLTRPQIETTLKDLDTGISINEWVKPYDVEDEHDAQSQLSYASTGDDDKYPDIACYEVL